MFFTDKFKNAKDLYYIGGVVRDEILGKKSLDVDLTYVGNAIDFVKTLEDVDIIQVNEPFGTVRVRIDGQEIDIASTRSEIYEKAGHLPTVTKVGCSLKEDVLRRDFTINALAKNFNTGEIVDYTGGLKDIREKKLRILHDRSFIDDPTRIIRALKFSVRFGFELGEHTKILRDNYLQNVNYDMSYKRVKKELIETFNLNSNRAYEEFINSNIYKLITPEKAHLPSVNIECIVNKYKNIINLNNIWLIYIATLPELSNLELTFTKEELKIVRDYDSIKNVCPKNDFEIYKMFENCRTETVLIYAILNDVKISEKYLDSLMNIKISITGEDLQNMGVKPSYKYKQCFEYVLKNKLENPQITYEQELDFAKTFLNCEEM